MSPFPYDVLWHYSEKFTRDPDLRQDLVLMAYQQDKRFGEQSEIRLLKHFMKYRSLEVSTRNSLGKSVGGNPNETPTVENVFRSSSVYATDKNSVWLKH